MRLSGNAGVPAPLYVLWELTRRCNLRCAHCYLPATGTSPLSFCAVSATMRRLRELGALLLTFSGGEVFLRPDLFRILRLVRAQGFAFKLFTNGTLIGRPEARALRALMPVSVEVSLYSYRAREHDAITGVAGSWARTVRGISLLKAQDVRVRIKCSVLQQNIAQIRKTLTFFRAQKVPFQINPLVMPMRDGGQTPLRYAPSPGQAADLYTVLRGVMRRSYRSRKKGGRYACTAGRSSVSISAEGKVFPCVALPIVAGSVPRDDIRRVWKRSVVLRRLRRPGALEGTECAACTLSTFCARCPGIAFFRTKDMRGTYPEACQQASAYRESCARPR